MLNLLEKDKRYLYFCYQQTGILFSHNQSKVVTPSFKWQPTNIVSNFRAKTLWRPFSGLPLFMSSHWQEILQNKKLRYDQLIYCLNYVVWILFLKKTCFLSATSEMGLSQFVLWIWYFMKRHHFCFCLVGIWWEIQILIRKLETVCSLHVLLLECYRFKLGF